MPRLEILVSTALYLGDLEKLLRISTKDIKLSNELKDAVKNEEVKRTNNTIMK